MKAITLTQPWATLVAIGAKRIETRSWRTHYRGPFAIHAAKGFPGWAKKLCYEEPFRSHLAKAGIDGPDQLPRGEIVAVCELIDCVQITSDNAPGEPERSFGDYTPGRWMWKLDKIQPLAIPIQTDLALFKERRVTKSQRLNMSIPYGNQAFFD